MNEQPEQPVSIREAARQLGIAHSTVSRQVSAGIIPNHGVPGRPLILVTEARAARAQNLDPSQRRGSRSPLFAEEEDGAPGTNDDPLSSASVPERGSYRGERSRREAALAQLAEIELGKQLGNLLDKGEVIDAVVEIMITLRETLQLAAHDVANRHGPEIAAIFSAEIHKALTIAATKIEQFEELPPGDFRERTPPPND